MQARFELEQLAGKAQVHRGARRIDRLPVARVWSMILKRCRLFGQDHAARKIDKDPSDSTWSDRGLVECKRYPGAGFGAEPLGRLADVSSAKF